MSPNNQNRNLNLYLIGYRGCGKSTLAPLVAAGLGWIPRDSDHIIQANANQTIAEIFAHWGEPEFRKLESRTIAEISQSRQQVVAMGGGAILAAENRDRLRQTGKTVWLKAPAELLWQRINQDPASSHQRPNLTNQDGLSEINELLLKREPLYQQTSDWSIEIEGRTVETVSDLIVQWWLDGSRTTND